MTVSPRIYVSGIGMVSPLGASCEKTWQALLEGKTGILKSQNGLEARIFDFSPNGARSRMGDFALLAAAEALRQAGLSDNDIRGENIGCAVSQSKPLLQPPPIPPTEQRGGGLFDSTLLFSSFFGWSSESLVAREFGLEGPSSNLVAACATGIASLQMGVQWIRTGLCEIVLVGASESSLNEFYRAGFQQMGVLADEKNGVASARPFDKNRSGFVMGEGAAVMVLESEASVQKRGHRPLAEVLNVALRQSARDVLRFDPSGEAVSSLITQVNPGPGIPDYINAHGTGTVFNDLVEARGIHRAFGKKAKDILVSSTKAATGHLLGAAGAVEAAIAVLALRDQVVPPTLNLDSPDPDCDLDCVPHQSRKAALSSALSLSYGFGGQMGAVLFGRVS
ncbi:MAG: 3-oxoacyl-[acyl-carrier-protein] synthase 2 [Elusimicrobia bacterium]|nr:3-oxoacyl-[acyl-carrier-protein] synthase 2 [Elusimicrobiota bacterium]